MLIADTVVNFIILYMSFLCGIWKLKFKNYVKFLFVGIEIHTARYIQVITWVIQPSSFVHYSVVNINIKKPYENLSVLSQANF